MITLLGGTGYVGSAFQRQLTQQGLPYEVLSRRQVDYTQPEVLGDYLKSRRPEFVINAAGYTGRPNVDACELHKMECLHGNAVLPGVIRERCEAARIPWGHVSSGCIYSGSRPDGSGFTEADPPNFSFRQNNSSFYSGCKALGEELLADAPDCYIWRLRIPFDNVDSPRNYITKLMRYERLLDAHNSLSHLDDFVRSCLASWTRHIPYGVYNLTNPGSVWTHDVIPLIRKYRLTDKSFSFFASEDEFMQRAALTPRSNCVLDSSKALAAGLPLRPIEEALEQALQHWKSETPPVSATG